MQSGRLAAFFKGFNSSLASGVQRSDDGQGGCLIVCPLPNSSIEQWCIVVIVLGYTLFVMSQYDIIFIFANQHFNKVC